MVVDLGRSVTVSAKIDDDLRKRMEKLGISPSVVIKDAVEEAVRRGEWERTLREMEKMGPILRKVGKKGWAKALRDTRDS